MSKQTCPKCNAIKYRQAMVELINDTHYRKKLQCILCGHRWDVDTPLLFDGNRYHFIWVAKEKRTMLLHRWVWEQKNRLLSDFEVIHHINHNKSDNRVSNLEMMSRYDHTGYFHSKGIRLCCEKCSHIWIPQTFKPRICPKCKSSHWSKQPSATISI